MDRLEKALDKARQLRQRIGVPSAPEPTPVRAPVLDGATADGARSQAARIQVRALEQNRIVSRNTRDANADIFRILRTKVMQAMAKAGMRTIAITSANYGDGKTTVATNLALSIALDVKQTVLLVDLDLRSPSVGKVLGLETEGGVGLSDYILDDVPVPQCLVRTDIERLSVLPITRSVDNSSELLGTPKMAALAHELKTRYADRIVIYDLPPMLSQDDTLAFLPHVDGVLLVVRDGVTPTDDVMQTLNSLGGATLIGTVLNDSAETRVNKV